MMKDASSRPAYSFSSLPRSGWFGGIGWPAASNIAAEAAYCASDGSHMTATCVVSVCFSMLRKWARAMPPQPIMATRTGVEGVMGLFSFPDEQNSSQASNVKRDA